MDCLSASAPSSPARRSANFRRSSCDRARDAERPFKKDGDHFIRVLHVSYQAANAVPDQTLLHAAPHAPGDQRMHSVERMCLIGRRFVEGLFDRQFEQRLLGNLPALNPVHPELAALTRVIGYCLPVLAAHGDRELVAQRLECGTLPVLLFVSATTAATVRLFAFVMRVAMFVFVVMAVTTAAASATTTALAMRMTMLTVVVVMPVTAAATATSSTAAALS